MLDKIFHFRHRSPYGERELKFIHQRLHYRAGDRSPYGERELKYRGVATVLAEPRIAPRMGSVS